MNVELTISSSLKELHAGDVVEGLLRVWPIENQDLSIKTQKELGELKEKKLFDSFYLSAIESLAVSENNADVVEMHAKLIVLKKFEVKNGHLELLGNDNFVKVNIPYNVIEETPAKDFFIANQARGEHFNWSYVGLAILGLVVLFFLLKLITKQKVRKIGPREIYKEKFLKAKTRENFEEIYLTKNEWRSLIQNENIYYVEFFKIMNEHQYRPHWKDEDLFEVKEAFDKIRGSFDE